MRPSLEGWPTKAKEKPSPHEVRGTFSQWGNKINDKLNLFILMRLCYFNQTSNKLLYILLNILMFQTHIQREWNYINKQLVHKKLDEISNLNWWHRTGNELVKLLWNQSSCDSCDALKPDACISVILIACIWKAECSSS